MFQEELYCYKRTKMQWHQEKKLDCALKIIHDLINWSADVADLVVPIVPGVVVPGVPDVVKAVVPEVLDVVIVVTVVVTEIVRKLKMSKGCLANMLFHLIFNDNILLERTLVLFKRYI